MIRNRWYVLADLMLFGLGTLAGFIARFEGAAGFAEFLAAWPYLLLSLPLLVGVLWACRVYRVLWRHAGPQDFVRLTAAGVLAGALNVVLGAGLLVGFGVLDGRVPLSVLSLSWLVVVMGPAALRGLERIYYLSAGSRRLLKGSLRRRRRRVLVAGAGEAGRMLVEELRRRAAVERIKPVGFLDSDVGKHRRTVAGLPVFGGHERLAEVVETTGADELVIAMPSASGAVVRQLTEAAREIDLEVRTVPSLLELATGRITASSLRKVRISDVLRREPISTDLAAVAALVAGRRVLVTGAGGSIGSELCRQLARLGPQSVGLLGHGENSIFEIEGELRRLWPQVRFDPIIADIRSRTRLEDVFREFAPHLVFHAAAHKHVPLMERNPAEAITNNVAGTLNVVELAASHGVQRLVMISTDKAVRPTSVMGASKRVAEQLVQEVAAMHGANFVAVRFGNVLGSRGSVVPTFLRQVAEGGPLTLTHPDMRRYFMTIPEAVQLVLQASVLGHGGEIFALDMGTPIRIADLAADLIRLSGLTPGRDIQIVYTGLRPGEKLHEEVFFEGEGVSPTVHPKILFTATPEVPGGLLSLVRLMEERASHGADGQELRSYLATLVPDFTPLQPAPAPPARPTGRTRAPVSAAAVAAATATGDTLSPAVG